MWVNLSSSVQITRDYWSVAQKSIIPVNKSASKCQKKHETLDRYVTTEAEIFFIGIEKRENLWRWGEKKDVKTQHALLNQFYSRKIVENWCNKPSVTSCIDVVKTRQHFLNHNLSFFYVQSEKVVWIRGQWNIEGCW